MMNFMKKKPDFTVYHKGRTEPYLERWFLIPRNKVMNIYLHKFSESDYDRGLHDHPWWSLSFLLKGEMLEHTLNETKTLLRFMPVIRSAKFLHKLELIKGPAWTIFITGPVIRKWGFYTKEQGWVYWETFLCNSQDNNHKQLIESKLGLKNKIVKSLLSLGMQVRAKLR